MDLGGIWAAAPSSDELKRSIAEADLGEGAWEALPVPGHWSNHPAFSDSDGPVLYRRHFEAAAPEGRRRSFLTFDGIFYQGDMWLDGEYLGDTEGYFNSHSFEVTAALRSRSDHVLSVEVACSAPSDRRSKRNLTGVFQHWDCIDPAWNPGGIWGGVSIRQTGRVRIHTSKLLCQEANPERATLSLEAELETTEPGPVRVVTTVRREGRSEPVATTVSEQDLASGANRVKWLVGIDRPDLWWPRALGGQPLYEVAIEVWDDVESSGEDDLDPVGPDREQPSDRVVKLTGLRRIRVRNYVATVNGERLFLKGVNYGPTRRALADTNRDEIERDVTLAADAGLDLMRVHAHIARPELYEAADRVGMLLWQDLPLQWGYGQVRRQAVEQARQAVSLLGHHPSVAVWCGHNEPMAVDTGAGDLGAGRTIARVAAAQALPSWNKTALDRSVRRALERADGTREVIAHSGVVPHPAWGTDSHLYYGWYNGEERDFPKVLARLPVLGRFVSEFGAQAVPDSDEFMSPGRWPDLDWESLERHHCMQRAIFEQRVPPDHYDSFESWRRATQGYQATVIRHQIEALRRLKYRPTGGFCVFMLTDAQPAVSWSVLDHARVPKAAYWAMADACAPVIITAERPAASYRSGERLVLDIHAVSDLRTPLVAARARAWLHWPGGTREWRFEGNVAADSCVRVGRIVADIPDPVPTGPLTLDLSLEWDGGRSQNSYSSRIV